MSGAELAGAAFLGVVGCAGGMMKRNFPIAPLLIGVIVGPIAEQNYRRAMIQTGGSCEWAGVLRRDGGKYLTSVCPYSHRGELEKGRLICESLLFKGLT